MKTILFNTQFPYEGTTHKLKLCFDHVTPIHTLQLQPTKFQHQRPMKTRSNIKCSQYMKKNIDFPLVTATMFTQFTKKVNNIYWSKFLSNKVRFLQSPTLSGWTPDQTLAKNSRKWWYNILDNKKKIPQFSSGLSAGQSNITKITLALRVSQDNITFPGYI